MSNKEVLVEKLRTLAIPCEVHEHAPAATMEECLALPYAAPDVTFCKNILLCNRQETAFYLYVTLPDKPFRTSEVSKHLGSSRLSFAPPERLLSLLGVHSGSLSPLALWLAPESGVTLALDQDVRRPGRIAFHPGDNAATVIFPQEIFWEQVVPLLGARTLTI